MQVPAGRAVEFSGAVHENMVGGDGVRLVFHAPFRLAPFHEKNLERLFVDVRRHAPPRSAGTRPADQRQLREDGRRAIVNLSEGRAAHCLKNHGG